MPSSCLCFCKASALKANPGWLFWLASGWLGLASGWLSGWFGLAPGWLSGWFGLAPGWLSGWFGLAFFFSCFLARLAETQLLGILQAYLGVIILQPHACTQRFRLRILRRTRSNDQMLDGRVLKASQVEYKPFGKPPLKREASTCCLTRCATCSSVRCAGCLVAPPSSFTGSQSLRS